MIDEERNFIYASYYYLIYNYIQFDITFICCHRTGVFCKFILIETIPYGKLLNYCALVCIGD